MHAIIEVVNFLRVVVVFGGGLIVGAGCIILLSRAAFYSERELWRMRRAMYTLAVVNALVFMFIAAVVIDRWDEPVGWRMICALLIFLSKGYFFAQLRSGMIDHERRVLFGETA